MTCTPPAPDAYAAGFADPVRDTQAAFRALMDAMARPGTRQVLPAATAPGPLGAGSAAVALTLLDADTALWCDHPLRTPEVEGWLRFRTGAPLVTDPAEADFLLVSHAAAVPPLAGLRRGLPAYPDRSATVIVDVGTLADALTGAGHPGGGRRLDLTGPGIDGSATLTVGALPPRFADQWAANVAGFPLGVDLILVAGAYVAALPRTTTARDSTAQAATGPITQEDPACTLR